MSILTLIGFPLGLPKVITWNPSYSLRAALSVILCLKYLIFLNAEFLFTNLELVNNVACNEWSFW